MRILIETGVMGQICASLLFHENERGFGMFALTAFKFTVRKNY